MTARSVRQSYLLAAVLVAVVAIWWLLGDDPEARVRQAHAELADLVSRTQDQSDAGLSVLQLRRLEAMFAASLSVSGDADNLVGNYSPQEIVALVVRAHSAFDRVELRFGEITVEFPEEALAVARFSASLDAVETAGDEVSGDAVTETRAVESRMRDIDGEWQFVSFTLTRP